MSSTRLPERLLSTHTLFALVDCNNFYVSCERVFDPALRGHPVVVLSNNDGCIISRSNEAKALGVPMGALFHEWRPFFRQHHVQVRSSNYPLYGDLSNRVMRLLAQRVPCIEVYSIDEAFLSLAGFRQSGVSGLASDLRQHVLRCTGIPVSIGIGPSKTLAKAGNKLAKRGCGKDGVLNWVEAPNAEEMLGSMDVEDVWGVGRRIGKTLKGMGVKTALALARMNPERVRRQFSVCLERTVLELGGTSCYPLGEGPASRQTLVHSRSFGVPVQDYDKLREAVATFTTAAAEKLRGERALARMVHVFITTNPFQPNQAQYANGTVKPLPMHTACTPELLRAALDGLAEIYRPGYRYKKAGVMLSEIIPASPVQTDLFIPHDHKGERLMKAVDGINREWGRDTVFYAASGIARGWKMRQGHLSRRYTTRWDELPIARA